MAKWRGSIIVLIMIREISAIVAWSFAACVKVWLGVCGCVCVFDCERECVCVCWVDDDDDENG